METERAIAFFEPTVVLFVGVAGGVKDVLLCDLVAATKVYGYESGKAKKTFLARPSVGESSYSMVQRARAESRRGKWMERLQGCKLGSPPRVHVGPIAAGEKVVASTRADIYRFLRSSYSDVIAVDMEGRGFLQAVHANKNLNALVVRGISDLLNGKKAADAAGYQSLAAKAASAFAFEVLANLEAHSPQERGKYVLVLSATIDEVDKSRAEAIVAHLRKLSGDTELTLIRVEEGSVRLVIKGSREGFETLVEHLELGQLSKDLGVGISEVTWIETFPAEPAETSDLKAVIEENLPAAKSGSREAMGRLLEAVYPMLTRFAQATIRRVISKSTWVDAEDLTQESLITIMRRIEHFGGDTASQFISWCHAVVRHGAVHSMRMHNVHKRIIPTADTYLDSAAAEDSLLENVEQLEEMRSLQDAIEVLSEREKLVLRFRYFEGLTTHEIAEKLEVSANMVRVLLHRSVSRLRKELRKRESGREKSP